MSSPILMLRNALTGTNHKEIVPALPINFKKPFVLVDLQDFMVVHARALHTQELVSASSFHCIHAEFLSDDCNDWVNALLPREVNAE